MFKNYDDYKNQRSELLNSAQTLLESGEMGEEYENLKKSVVGLDNIYEKFKAEQANLNALYGVQKPVMELINNVESFKNSEFATNSIDTAEYRKSFMNHIIKGEPILSEFSNSSEVSKTGDLGVLIPNTVLNRIIEKIEASGMILPLVTRTSYKGGVSIPTSNVKPKAVWVSEGVGSDTQKKTVGSITFAYHKLRCAIAVSLETDTMAMSSFETAFVNSVSEAMLKSLEQAIINGDGSGKPKGILTEQIEESKKIEVKADERFSYNTLVTAEGKLDLAYENGAVWFMHKTTFMEFMGMVDTNGQPIARVSYGIGGSPERSLLGRKVILNEYMTSVKSQLSTEAVVAFLFNPKDYILNTNLGVTVKRYENNETDDFVTKAIMLVDGKVVDKNSLVQIIKKVGASKTSK